MALSVFDVIGPIMVGPSSSHTAGAVRLGLVARQLLGHEPQSAVLTLHGSFASTGRGHASDRALISGLLGYAPDDARLPQAIKIAQQAGMDVCFKVEDFGEQAHPNSVRIELQSEQGQSVCICGSSVGGGIIEVNEVDGFNTLFGGDLDTIVCYHKDRSGFLARLTAVLSCADVNIATMRTSRQARGENALTIVETDGAVPADALSLLNRISWLSQIRTFAPLP